MTEAQFPVAGEGSLIYLSEETLTVLFDTAKCELPKLDCSYFLCYSISKRSIGKRHTSHTLASGPNIPVFPSPPVAA